VDRTITHTVMSRLPRSWQPGQNTGCLTCGGHGVVVGEACHCVASGLRAVEIAVVRLPRT
jgi:hypothetical protein